MQAQHFVSLVSLDALGAGVPGEDVAVAVEQINAVLADALDDGAQPRIVQPHSLLRRALLGGVADEGHHGRAVGGLHRLEHNVDGDFRAIFAQAEQIHGRAHLPGAGMGAVIFAMTGMAAAEARRHQHFYRLADQLFARVTEQLFGARVGCAHDAVSVGDEDRVRRELKKSLDGILGKTRMHTFVRTRVLLGGIRRAHSVLPTLAERYAHGP